MLVRGLFILLLVVYLNNAMNIKHGKHDSAVKLAAKKVKDSKRGVNPTGSNSLTAETTSSTYSYSPGSSISFGSSSSFPTGNTSWHTGSSSFPTKNTGWHTGSSSFTTENTGWHTGPYPSPTGNTGWHTGLRSTRTYPWHTTRGRWPSTKTHKNRPLALIFIGDRFADKALDKLMGWKKRAMH